MLRVLTLLMAIAMTLAPVHANTSVFPQTGRPIRLVVPLPAGGQADFQARLLAKKLSETLGVPVVVENKPGASSIIGVQHVARATPDGHTLLYTIASPIVVNPHMFTKLPYDALRDLTPVTLTATTAQVLVAHASIPAKNISELIAYAKSRPGSLNFGSYGTGSSSHLYGQMLQTSAGITMTHVPYKGASDVTKDLITGRIQLSFMALTAAQVHVQNDSLKILGVVGEARQPSMPNIPTLGEQGVAGLEHSGWLGIFAPANTPALVVTKLNVEIEEVLRMPDIVERFRRGGAEAKGTSPAAFTQLVREDYNRWRDVVHRLGLRLD